MSIEALWSVHFATQGGAGGGVVIFETGKIFGGDSQYYWVGNYTVQNGQLIADIDVSHYSGPPYSVFGPLQKFRLNLRASPPSTSGSGTTMQATGTLVNNPSAQIVMLLTYRAPLP
jgi:hypothetical protein